MQADELAFYYVVKRKSLRKILSFFLAGAVGIEPTLTVLETAVLPLNYAPRAYIM